MDGQISQVHALPPRFSAPAGAYVLHLLREDYHPDCTIGKLFLDGTWKWYTLEDPVRKGAKIPGETAIPAGAYQIIQTYSPRFGRVLPLLLGVPNFSAIRIHPANAAKDVAGCIGVGGGYDRAQHRLVHSRVASDAVNQAINQALVTDGRQVWIEVVDREGAETR